jgi:flagellin
MSALSALQALNTTQQAMDVVQNQVSTGLAVATAADNSSYWSISTQLNQNDGIVQAANTALTEGQSMLSTATSAINSVISTLKSMASTLTEAQNQNATYGAVNTSLASAGQQLVDAVSNASFNGLNILNGSITTTIAAGGTGVSFVSGYNATSSGGTVNTIDMATQSLYTSGGVTATDLLNAKGTATGAVQVDLTTLGTGTEALDSASGTTLTSASNALDAVNAALTAVTNYAATIGATQDRMTAASTFNSALDTNLQTGVSGLVDANMNTASTKLQALQTQEQLGIQSLSIANQQAQLILKLFQ